VITVRRLPAGLLIAAIVLGACALPADADSVQDAATQARNIAAQIIALQPGVDAALAAYDTALDGVAQSVSDSVAARNVYDRLQAEADTANEQAATRVVALYEAGGPVGLDAAALAGGTEAPSDLPYLAAVIERDSRQSVSATRVARAAEQRMDVADADIGAKLADADVVDQRAEVLQGLLAQQQQLLDQASAKARALADLQAAAEQLAQSQAAAAAAQAAAVSSASPEAMPPLYRALFQSAATYCPGLPWQVLAAIGQVETHDGSGSMVSSAGALGPMQFEPGTFAEYAVDGDHDGVADIEDPADAIYTAARLLCVDGAGKGGTALYAAIWDYNHADWYVQLVLSLAAKIT
jgi:Transglycosylase SLT domain